MREFVWIGRTDTPKVPWGNNGENFTELMEIAKKEVKTEHHSILFRKAYLITKSVRKATVAVCGLGLYQLYLNGEKVGDAVLSPLETHYRKRVLYDEYDVTKMLRVGENVFAAEVGNGRYSTPEKYWNWRAAWYGDPCLTLTITLLMDDGSKEEFSTNESWKCSYGAIYENCFYDGESYDGQLEQDGWNTYGFNDQSWENVLRVDPPCDNLEQNTYFQIKKVREKKPVNSYQIEKGKVVYDFGENISGWVRICVKGEAGARLMLRYAECVTEDGHLNPASNRDALNIDQYVLNDKALQKYEPKFTLHGFSAVEVSFEASKVEVMEILAYEVHAALENRGKFSCDNMDINRLHEVILRTQKAALMSAPIDCPQRDERLGWLGDAHVTDLTCLYNFDMQRFYEKWLEDIRLNVHVETGAVPHIAPWHQFGHAIDWSAAYGIILWDAYLFYRDKELLERHCDTLIRYVEFLKTSGPIQEKTRYGDWMSVAEDWVRGDPASCSSMYYYYNLVNIVKILGVLGRREEQNAYLGLKEQTKEAILQRFYNVKEKDFDDNTQFTLSMALMLKLIPIEDEQAVLEKLVADVKEHDYHLTTGILGTKYVMEVLRDYGRQDIAMKLILQKTYPGWLNMIEGKTTLLECWDSRNSAASQNHCMFGSVDGIFYSMLAGIRVGEEILVEPYYAQELNRVNASVKLYNGVINVSWERRGEKVYTTVGITGDVEATLKCGATLQKVTQGRYVYENH